MSKVITQPEGQVSEGERLSRGVACSNGVTGTAGVLATLFTALADH